MRAVKYGQGILLVLFITTAFGQLPNIPIGTRVLINDGDIGRSTKGEVTSGSGGINGDITNPSGLGCSDGAIDLNISGGSGPYDITWFDRDGAIGSALGVSGNDGNEDIDELPAGFYQVVVEDAMCGQATAQFGLLNGENKISLVEIQNVQSCEVRSDGTVLSTCDGALSVSVAVDVPYEIEWFGPNNFYAKGTETVTDLCAGEYTVKIEILEGCIFFENFSLCCCEQFNQGGDGPKNNALPESCTSEGYTFPLTIYTDIYESPSTATSTDGRIRINYSGGNGEVAISWSGPNGFTSNALDISGLGVGTYCATLIDGCSASEQCFELVDCSAANLNVGASIRPTCEGFSLGRIDLNVTGINPPFRYRWDDNSREIYRDFLEAGIYCVTVSDSKGCSERNICFTVGYTDFRYIEQSQPCGTGIYCTDFRVDFIPFTGNLDCRFDDPSSCRTLNCYCPLTNEQEGPPRTLPYIDTEIDIANCQIIGYCPEGGTEIAEFGNTVSVSVPASLPDCLAYASICCIRLDFCIISGSSYLQNIVFEGTPTYEIDARCGGPGGCVARCGNEIICVEKYATETSPCNRGIAPLEVSRTELPEATLADALLKLHYHTEQIESDGQLWLPVGINLGSTLSEYQKQISKPDGELLKVFQQSIPPLDLLEHYANYQYFYTADGDLLMEPKEKRQDFYEESSSLQAFPNPSNDEVVIRSRWSEAYPLEITLMNALGEVDSSAT